MGGPVPWVNWITIFLVYHLVNLFFRLFTRTRVTGEENIPQGGGVLYLSNHISALDVFCIPWVIYTKYPHEPLRQVSKEELLRIPVIGWILGKIRAFPIKRGRADMSAIREIENFIRNEKVIIYPEGTRSRDGKLGKGNRMVGKFIRGARPVVIPVAVKGTDNVLPVGKLFPKMGVRIEIAFGAPLDLGAELGVEDVKESSILIVDKVMVAISSLLDGMDSSQAAPPRAMEEAGE